MFESDRLKTNIDVSMQSHAILQTFVWVLGKFLLPTIKN